MMLTALLAKLRIDDPIGSIAIHLGGGIWGTLAVALFSDGPQIYPKYDLAIGPERGLLLGGPWEPLGIQLLGVGVVGLFVVLSTVLVWVLLDNVYGRSLRISPDQELQRIDTPLDASS